jgi:hypothetical protein
MQLPFAPVPSTAIVFEDMVILSRSSFAVTKNIRAAEKAAGKRKQFSVHFLNSVERFAHNRNAEIEECLHVRGIGVRRSASGSCGGAGLPPKWTFVGAAKRPRSGGSDMLDIADIYNGLNRAWREAPKWISSVSNILCASRDCEVSARPRRC